MPLDFSGQNLQGRSFKGQAVFSRPSFYSNVEQVGIMTNNPGGISQNMSGGQMDGGMQAI